MGLELDNVERRNRNRSWWQHRTRMERCSIVIIAVATVLIIALIVALVVLANKHRVRSEDEICNTAGCVEAAAVLLKNMDQSVDPCDDFYDFVCGSFIRNTYIPDDKLEVSPVEDLGDVVQLQLRNVLQKPSPDEETEHLKLVKRFYKLCINERKLENLTNIKELIKNLGGWPALEGTSWNQDSFDWKESVSNFRKYGINAYNFIKIEVEIDTTNSSRTIISLNQPELDFGRGNLLKGSRTLSAIGYVKYLTDMVVLFGADRVFAENEAKNLVEFQIQLANITLSNEAHRDALTSYDYISVRELQKRYPTVFWLEFLNKFVDLPNITVTNDQKVRVIVPTYLSKIGYLLDRASKRAQANHAIFELLSQIELYLPKAIRDRRQQFNAKTFGLPISSQRWKECVAETSKNFEIGAGALYVREYFNEGSKQSALDMVSDIGDAFIKILKETDWMDKETKEKAIEKAEAMTPYVGYSEEYFDDNIIEEQFSGLQVTSDNIFDFVGNATLLSQNQAFETLAQGLNKTDTGESLSPTKVNAGYNPQFNSIDVPAAILQGVIFNKDRLRSMNYGSMGFFIGHEITHGFDNDGRKYDKDGNIATWWPEEVIKAFEDRAECIVEQYSNYTVPELGINLNGKLTEGENIADNGGVKEAYIAYNSWVEGNGPESRLPGLNYTARQLFWISAATCWCAKEKRASLAATVSADEHSPNRYRVIGTFSNLDDFAKDFQCPQGSKMNPKHKCKVW